jgi:predicted ATP-dependent protease
MNAISIRCLHKLIDQPFLPSEAKETKNRLTRQPKNENDKGKQKENKKENNKEHKQENSKHTKSNTKNLQSINPETKRRPKKKKKHQPKKEYKRQKESAKQKRTLTRSSVAMLSTLIPPHPIRASARLCPSTWRAIRRLATAEIVNFPPQLPERHLISQWDVATKREMAAVRAALTGNLFVAIECTFEPLR